MTREGVAHCARVLRARVRSERVVPCGYEPTAVVRTTGSFKESLRAAFGN